MTDLLEEELGLNSVSLSSKFQNLKNSIVPHITPFKPLFDQSQVEKVNSIVILNYNPSQKLINIFYHVCLLRRFCNKLKSSIEETRTKALIFKRSETKTFINDLTNLQSKSYIFEKKPQNIIEIFFNTYIHKFLEKIDKKIPLFQQYSRFIMIWSILMHCLFFVIIVGAPWNIVIRNNEKIHNHFDIFLNVSIIILVVDIFLKFNTGFLKNGASIKIREHILQKYFEKTFLKDLFGIISLSLEANHPIFLLMFVFYLLKLKKFVKNYENYFKIPHWEIIKMILMMFLLTHYISCFWVFIGRYGISLNYCTWLTARDLINKKVLIQYLYSLFHALEILSLTDTGWIVPQNELEVIVTILLRIIAFANFIYFGTHVGFFIFKSLKKKTENNEKIVVMKEFLKENKISLKTLSKFRNYLKHTIKAKEFEDKIKKQDELISNMPESLQNNLLKESIDRHIKKIPAISKNFSSESIRKLRKCFQKIKIYKNQTIFSHGDTDDKSLYLILKGTVVINLTTNEANPVLETMKPNEILGVLTFFSNKPRSFTAKSLTDTVLLKLNQDIFLRVLKENRNDYERFCEINDNINLYNDLKDIFICCRTCSLSDHNEQFCPLNHYVANRENIINKFNFSRPEKERRNCLTRKKQKKKYKKFPFRQKPSEILALNSSLLIKNDNDYEDTFSDEESSNESFHKKEASKKETLIKTFEIDIMKTNDNLSYFSHNYFKRIIDDYSLNKKKLTIIYQSNLVSSRIIMNSFGEIPSNEILFSN